MTAKPLPHQWLPGADTPNSLAQQVQENFDALAVEDGSGDATTMHNPPAAGNFNDPGIAINTIRQVDMARTALVFVDFEIDTVSAAGDAQVTVQVGPSSPPGINLSTWRTAGVGAARDLLRVTPVVVVPAAWFYRVVTSITAPATVTLNQIREVTF